MTSNKIILLIGFVFICLSSSYAQTYEVMQNVKCYDQDDQLLKNAFAGGLNLPQFNEIDIDLDGVDDLVIFDREGGGIVPYLYKDNDYVYSPEYKNIFPRFKKWVRMRDYNADGVMDIFCYNLESPLDGIEIYTGSVENDKLKFDKVTETKGNYEIIYYLLQGNWFNLEVISSDIPDVIDVDSDGDLDIITFTGDGGYVRWYKNTSVEDGKPLDSIRFKLEDICWGKFYESGFNDNIKLSDDPTKCKDPEFTSDDDNPTKTAVRHAGSTTTLYDDDGDGDYEIIIGDLTNQNLVWIDNGGTPEDAWGTSIDTFWPVYDEKVDMFIFNAGYIIDVDRDGNDDFIAAPNYESGSANIDNVWYYRNIATDGQHDFEFVTKNVFSEDMFDFGSLSNPATCDFNQDGKKDIVIGTLGYFRPSENPDARLILLENVSTDDEIAFKLVTDNYLDFKNINNTYFSFAPTFGDMDSDGDDDLLVGVSNGSLLYLQNTAGPGNEYEFGPIIFDYMDIDVGENVKPQIIDLNRDGLLDIVLGERSQNAHPEQDTRLGNLNYFQNQGTPEVPMFTSDSKIAPNTNVLGNVVTKDNTTFNGSAAPFFIDSGDDFFLYTGAENGKIKHFNVGPLDSIYGTFNLLDDEIRSMWEGGRSSLAIDDLNGDGLLEIVVGNSRGGVSIYGTNLGLDGIVGEESFEIADVDIYPNPTSDYIHIKSGDIQIKSIEIHTQLGQLMHREKGLFSEKTINTKSWPSGVYFVSVEDKNQAKRLVKIVKN